MDKWVKKDLKYVWHPYTQMKDCQKLPPVFIKKARGIKLYDNKGKFYYDTISSWWCNVHGHNHPKINEAVKKQLRSLDHILFAGFTHEPAILLAERLVSLAPKNLTKVFFSDNGSTAVEAALKMSFQFRQNTGKKSKKRFVCLDYAYHGDTIGAMSVSGVGLFNKVFKPLFFSSFKVPAPYCYRCPVKKERSSCRIDCAKPLEKLLDAKSSEISAMIIEPMVLAAGGMIIYPARYLRKIRELTQKYDVHLISDEVAVGFGRTGRMFAGEHAQIQPDFMCLSKGITSGTLPLAATLTTDEVYNAFYDDYEKLKTFYHGHTYTANPLACSAALASLNIFDKEKTIEKIQKIIPFFHERLDKFREFDFAGDVRYIGLIGAVELVKDKIRKKTFDFKERIGLEIYKQGLKENLILRPLGQVIYFYLPLCITKEDIKVILDKTLKIIKKVHSY